MSSTEIASLTAEIKALNAKLGVRRHKITLELSVSELEKLTDWVNAQGLGK